MTKVRDIMTTDVVTLSPQSEIAEAVRLLIKKKFNGVPVVDDEGRLRGIICKSDLIAQQKNVSLPSFFTILDGYIPLASMKHVEKEIEKMAATTVAEAMTLDPVTISPDASLEEAATVMVEKKFYTIPVVEGKKLVGIIGKEDLLKTLPRV